MSLQTKFRSVATTSCRWRSNPLNWRPTNSTEEQRHKPKETSSTAHQSKKGEKACNHQNVTTVGSNQYYIMTCCKDCQQLLSKAPKPGVKSSATPKMSSAPMTPGESPRMTDLQSMASHDFTWTSWSSSGFRA